MNWQPIETAPKDGRPIWAKGDNYGDPTKGAHYAWVFWLDDRWAGPLDTHENEHPTFLYPTHWMEGLSG